MKNKYIQEICSYLDKECINYTVDKNPSEEKVKQIKDTVKKRNLLTEVIIKKVEVMKLQLKEGELESVSTDDFYYDLFKGGYFKPEKFLDETSAEKVREAMKIINQYESLLENNDLIEEM